MATHDVKQVFEEIARLRRECAPALLGSRCAQRLASRALADADAALDHFDAGLVAPRDRAA